MNETQIMKTTSKNTKRIALTSMIAGALALSSAHAALMIQYDFEGNTAAAATNDLTSLGVTAGDIQTSNTHGNNTGIANERWQRKLLGGSPSTMSFSITIPANVTLDFTEISFLFGMDSRQGSNDTWG